jgi:hypothetical protein
LQVLLTDFEKGGGIFGFGVALNMGARSSTIALEHFGMNNLINPLLLPV